MLFPKVSSFGAGLAIVASSHDAVLEDPVDQPAHIANALAFRDNRFDSALLLRVGSQSY
jgi:hypothetical protein